MIVRGVRKTIGWLQHPTQTQTPTPDVLGFWDHRVAAASGRSSRAFWKGMQWGAEGALIGLPFIALEAGLAHRGEVVPTAMARTAGLVTYPALSGLTSAALTVLFPELRGAAFLGGLLGMYPDAMVQGGLLRGVRFMTDAARQTRHLEFGGTYQDSEFAQSQRRTALTEMSGALAASRRYLGQEAALLHR